MKIFKDNAVYVQKKDLAFLFNSDLLIPASIVTYLFDKNISIIDNANGNEFVRFEEEDEIDFFAALDWLIDYDAFKDLDVDQLKLICQSIEDERKKIALSFNAMSNKERKENQHLRTRFQLLDYKLYSLKEILYYKRGNSIAIQEELDTVREDRGLKKFFHKMRNFYSK